MLTRSQRSKQLDTPSHKTLWPDALTLPPDAQNTTERSRQISVLNEVTSQAAPLVLVVVLIAGACAGGDDNASETAADVEAGATVNSTAAAPPAAPEFLPDSTAKPVGVIEVGDISVIVDGEANDDFDRCSVFAGDELAGLLGDMWPLGAGAQRESTGCSWTVGSGENLGYVLVVLAAAGDEFDPRLGDSAAAPVPGDAAVGDDYYEITGSTFGPGVAFRQGDVGVQVHVVWGTPDPDARIAVEREAELRIADNISSRLQLAG
jgi:hypothetical protein